MNIGTCLLLLLLLPVGLYVEASSLSMAGKDSQKMSDASRSYWLPDEVNGAGSLDRFQEVVSNVGVAIKNKPAKPINIALIYPSNDVSDFWDRNYIALIERLEKLGIPHKTTEFSSRQIEHTLQTRYTDRVLSRAEDYDIVIFGPSELLTQEENIQRLAASKQFHTFIWAFHTPQRSWQSQPKIWFDFSSSVGAKAMCSYLLRRLGSGVQFVMNRGIPGITDNQRSGEFKFCVEANGNWFSVYENYGQYQKAGGKDGVTLINKYFPEAKVLHNANTAMAVGSTDT